MASKIEFHNPAFPKGTEFDIGGVLVPNGGSVELSADDEASFESRNGASPKDFFKDAEMVKVSGAAKGGDS